MLTNSLVEGKIFFFCYNTNLGYNGRNLFYTSLLEFIDYDILFGKGRVELLLGGNLRALGNLNKVVSFILTIHWKLVNKLFIW